MIKRNSIVYGDVRQTLPDLWMHKAQMCVTSPPYYGLRDYGGEENQVGQEETPEEYINNMVKIFRLVRDNLQDDGTLWSVSYTHLRAHETPEHGVSRREL